LPIICSVQKNGGGEKTVTFYKETNFKETPIGKIPEGWGIVKFGEVCKFKRGLSYRSNQITKDPTKIRFITINDFEKEGGLKRDAEKVYIKEGVYVDPDFFLTDEDVLIANTDMSRGFIIGAPILIKDIDDKLVYSMDLTKLIFNKSKIDGEFLFYYLTHETVRQKMKTFAQGTNVLHLNHRLVKNMRVPLPLLLEQKAIAHILSTVDEAIQKTDEIIAKTEKLKKGLMQELLTKGVGHKEFKDTEIGRIPKGWEVVKLMKITTKIKDIDHKMPNKVKEGIPFVSVKYMLKYPDYDFRIVYTDPDLEFISEKDYQYHKRRFDAEKGDIIYSRFGTIGHAKLIQTEERFIASYSIVLIKPKTIVYPLYLVYALNSEKVRLQAKIATKGATNRNLHLEDIKNLKLPLPPLEEQKKISEILSTVDKKLDVERNEKAKLERIKQGLMDLLLTGKIRVKVGSENAICSC